MRRTDRGLRRRGFTLFELLVTVAILGMIFAIVVPYMLDSLHRAKQKRIVGDVRDVGMAWYSWLTDQMAASAAGASGTHGGRFDFSHLDQPLTADELLQTLYQSKDHFYIQSVPEDDAWGNPYDYAWSGDMSYSEIIGIRSLGRDRIEGPSMNPYTMGPFDATEMDEDIVWADGFFIRFPSGTKVQ